MNEATDVIENVNDASVAATSVDASISGETDEGGDPASGAAGDAADEAGAKGISRARKRELVKSTLRHPDELTIAVDGSFADDGRADLPLDEGLVRSMLYFSSQDGPAAERRAYQHLDPVSVTIGGTDECPVFILSNGRQRKKAADAINARVRSILPIWEACKHDRVKTRNALVSFGLYAEALRRGENVEPPAAAPGLDEAQRCALTAWTNTSTASEEMAILYVGGEMGGAKHAGLVSKHGQVPYYLKVQYRDTPANDPSTLAISATLKNVQVDNLPSMEAEQIRRLCSVTAPDKSGTLVRVYSDETIAGFLSCSVPTLHNKLLILEVEPAVRDALDRNDISWRTLKKSFFVSAGRGKVQPLPPAEQIAMLNELTGRGISKSTHAEAAGLVGNRPAGTASGDSAGADVSGDSASADGSGTSDDAGTPTRSANAPTPRSKSVRLIGDAGFFARAAARLEQVVNEAPPVDEAGIDAQEYLDRRLYAASLTTAQAVVLFLKNNDPRALDEVPALKAALCSAMEQPDEAPTKPEARTRSQHLANRVRECFEQWDQIRGDERPEWPTVDGAQDADLQTAIDKIAAAFDAQDDGAPDYESDKVTFAQLWVLGNLLGIRAAA